MALPLTVNDFLDRAIAVFPDRVSERARTATGKLQKYRLREPFWAGMTREVN
jgi:hypothetical protein